MDRHLFLYNIEKEKELYYKSFSMVKVTFLTQVNNFYSFLVNFIFVHTHVRDDYEKIIIYLRLKCTRNDKKLFSVYTEEERNNFSLIRREKLKHQNCIILISYISLT